MDLWLEGTTTVAACAGRNLSAMIVVEVLLLQLLVVVAVDVPTLLLRLTIKKSIQHVVHREWNSSVYRCFTFDNKCILKWGK